MKKSAKGEDARKAARGQLWLHLPGMVREALHDTVIGAGLACVDEVLEMERVPEPVAIRGISKSALSERFVYGTERKLAELMSRDLRQRHVVALLIDGVHFGAHVVLAAVGVDAHGDEHVLGLREGATENAAAVRALLADLVERGLATERSLLIVIDGAKALHKAVVELFGAHALIQRCREHKKRNVTAREQRGLSSSCAKRSSDSGGRLSPRGSASGRHRSRRRVCQ
jgi:putative transposase